MTTAEGLLVKTSPNQQIMTADRDRRNDDQGSDDTRRSASACARQPAQTAKAAAMVPAEVDRGRPRSFAARTHDHGEPELSPLRSGHRLSCPRRTARRPFAARLFQNRIVARTA